MTLLHPGDKFPVLTVALPGGDSLQLPDALNGHYGVVLFYRGSWCPYCNFYRGSWCPYCNAQLSAFQRARERRLNRPAPGGVPGHYTQVWGAGRACGV